MDRHEVLTLLTMTRAQAASVDEGEAWDGVQRARRSLIERRDELRPMPVDRLSPSELRARWHVTVEDIVEELNGSDQVFCAA